MSFIPDILLELHWAYPWVLLLIPVLAILFFFRKKFARETPSLMLPQAGAIIPGKSLKKSFRNYGVWLPFLSAIALTLALARPQKVLTRQEFKGEGIEIMLALDVSPSMLSMDFKPNRLEVAKQLAIEFVKARKGDKIGLTVFAGEAFTKCPLTTDYRTLERLLRELKPDNLELGTAIGMGLATAVNQLKKGKAKSKIVILLTDGSNNRGELHPMDAAEIARLLGIKVYTIGMGSKGIVNMPVRKTPGGEFIFAPVPSDFDESLLRQIAQHTGGKYFRARTKKELEAVYDAINRLERSKIEVISHSIKIERFRPFLLAGIALIVLYWLLVFLWVKPLP